VRVVDFTMGWAGPLATRTLADLGADVVKVESTSHPDWYRGWEAGAAETAEVQANFNMLNRNKRGVDLELEDAAGLAAARRLVGTADVVIENYAAGVLDKLGLGTEEQRRARPGIVSVTMAAFGTVGPLSATRAYGSTVEQASGLPYVNGREAWPALQHVAFGDAIAGLYAVTAALVGLHVARRGGSVEVDLAQVACLFEIGADAIIGEQVLGRPLPRTGNHRRGATSDVVASADEHGWLAVVAASDEQRLALEGVLGGRDLAAWASARDAASAAAELQSAGVPAARVVAPHELGHDEHLRATGFWRELDRAFVGRHATGAPPFKIDGQRPAGDRPAPTLGQHTAEVLAEV
jgi:crotonobetainyl-CoA:carnitine CoA-transferase CaiB-like acyl-CoA transferase